MISCLYISLALSFLVTLSTAQASSNSSSTSCSLPTAQNATFLNAGFTLRIRPWDEAIAALSSGWAPSTDSRFSSIVISNDTFLPPFWVQAVSLESTVDNTKLVSFFDDRFQLCVTFFPSIPFCANGSRDRPGQFLFSSVKLTINGNYYFVPQSIEYLPLGAVVTLPNTPKFCCVNVTNQLTTGDASLLRFSPAANDGVLYNKKIICASVGIPLTPISVELVRVANSSYRVSSQYLSQPYVTVTDIPVIFLLKLLSGVSDGISSNAQVLQSWNISVAAGSVASAVFSAVVVSSFLESALVVVEAFSTNMVPLTNSLQLQLAMSRLSLSICSLTIPQQRNPAFISQFSGQWGVPISPLVPLPKIFVVRSSAVEDGLIASSFLDPIVAFVQVKDASGNWRSDALGGVTSVILADGVAIFEDLYFLPSALTLSTQLFWLVFCVQPRNSVLCATSYPLRVSLDGRWVSGAVPPSHAMFDPRNDQAYFEGAMIQVSPGEMISPISILLMNAAMEFFTLQSSQQLKISVSARSCATPIINNTASSLGSPKLFCGRPHNENILLRGTNANSMNASGAVLFDDLRIITTTTLSSPLDVLLEFRVTGTLLVPDSLASDAGMTSAWQYIDGYSLTALVHLVPPVDAAKTYSASFPRQARVQSLFVDEYQSARCLLGTPMPPITIAVERFGAGDLINETQLQVVAFSDSAVLQNSVAVAQNNFLLLPGVVVLSSLLPVIRIRFMVSSGSRVVQRLDTGPITLFSELSYTVPFRLSFSMSASSFISGEDTIVAALNVTIFPLFRVVVSRVDQLHSGDVQTVRDPTNVPPPLVVSQVTCRIYDGRMLSSFISINSSRKLLSVQNASLVNGVADVSFPSITFQGSTASLMCCLSSPEAINSCTRTAMIRVYPKTFDLEAWVPSVTLTPAVAVSGVSVSSEYFSSGPLGVNTTLELTSTLFCVGESATLSVCTGVGNANSTALFTIALNVTPLSPSLFAAVSNVVAGSTSLTVSLASWALTPPDGFLMIVLGVDRDMVSHASANVVAPYVTTSSQIGLQAPLPTQFPTFVVYLNRPYSFAFPFLMQEDISALLGVDSRRLWVGHHAPASMPLDAFNSLKPGFSALMGTRLEVSVSTPYTFSSKSDTITRISNGILAIGHSCAAMGSSAQRKLVPFLNGYAMLQHSSLQTGGVGALKQAPSFCDAPLFESLAESSRHCEMFLGPDHRCSCFLNLFVTLGTSCLTVGSLVSVCDHAAYCTDDSITSVCKQVEPNIALQVFFVIGGTILCLAIVTAIAKYRSIITYFEERRPGMHGNDQYLVSRQSASAKVFT